MILEGKGSSSFGLSILKGKGSSNWLDWVHDF